ncbi:MAG: hemerythrin family protein [Ignavibacteria bacterium]|nr:hemerythrin family protein [Ignavibacteria bacterium]
MSLILWNNGYSVNIKSIDAQHQRLVEMINKLHDAMKKGESNAALSGILNDMAAYTLVHFKTEEELFAKYNYPMQDKHKAEHKAFVGKVSAFIDEFKSGRKTLSIDVMNFLTQWLTKHISGEDKAYTSFLNSKGVV